MSIGAAFFAKTQALTALTDLVGARVFAEEADTNNCALPYLVYHIPIDDNVGSHSGPSTISQATLLVEVHAETDEQRTEVVEVIRNKLHGKRNDTWGAHNIRTCDMKARRSDFETAQDNSQDVDFLRILELNVWYREALPTG